MKPFKIIFIIYFIFEVAYFIYSVNMTYNDDYVKWVARKTNTNIDIEGKYKEQFDYERNTTMGVLLS